MSEYDELEEVAGAGGPEKAPDFTGPIYKRLFEGLAAPFFNPNAAKEYYRFLFGGLLMLVGCFMPFDSNWDHVGYKSLAGGVILVISLGVVWSAWISINIPSIVKMKWYLLATVPLIWSLVHLIFLPTGMAWSDLGDAFANFMDGGLRDAGDFFQHLGPGKLFILLGSLMVEFTFLMGIFGGVQQIKADKRSSRRR